MSFPSLGLAAMCTSWYLAASAWGPPLGGFLHYWLQFSSSVYGLCVETAVLRSAAFWSDRLLKGNQYTDHSFPPQSFPPQQFLSLLENWLYCRSHNKIILDNSVSIWKAHIPLLHGLQLKNIASLWSNPVQILIINCPLLFFPLPHRNAAGIYSKAKCCCVKFVG